MENKKTNKLATLFLAGLLVFAMTGCEKGGDFVDDNKAKDDKNEEVVSNNDDITITQEKAEEMIKNYDDVKNIIVLDYGTSKNEYENGQEINEILDDVELEQKGYGVRYSFDETRTHVDGTVEKFEDVFQYDKPQEEYLEYENSKGDKVVSKFKCTKVYKIIGVSETDRGIEKMVYSDGYLLLGGNVLTEELSNLYYSKLAEK